MNILFAFSIGLIKFAMRFAFGLIKFAIKFVIGVHLYSITTDMIDQIRFRREMSYIVNS